MTREIKFRGKHIEEGRWYHGSLIVEDENGCTIVGKLFGEVPVDPATVGQFTGLLDKDGREIYEGDVLKHVDYPGGGDFLYEVDISAKKGVAAYGPQVYEDADAFHEMQIVGNIHDNPEILNPKQS